MSRQTGKRVVHSRWHVTSQIHFAFLNSAFSRSRARVKAGEAARRLGLDHESQAERYAKNLEGEVVVRPDRRKKDNCHPAEALAGISVFAENAACD